VASHLSPAATGGTILIIGDEEGVRHVAQSILERSGFAVLTASDGTEGIEVFQTHIGEIAVVLLDMTMPRMTGEETFRELHRLCPEVPAILTSGYHEQDALSHFAGKGLAGFVQKPFQLSELVRKVSEVASRTPPPMGRCLPGTRPAGPGGRRVTVAPLSPEVHFGRARPRRCSLPPRGAMRPVDRAFPGA
jgi:CheY-like chemotaxis protein